MSFRLSPFILPEGLSSGSNFAVWAGNSLPAPSLRPSGTFQLIPSYWKLDNMDCQRWTLELLQIQKLICRSLHSYLILLQVVVQLYCNATRQFKQMWCYQAHGIPGSKSKIVYAGTNSFNFSPDIVHEFKSSQWVSSTILLCLHSKNWIEKHGRITDLALAKYAEWHLVGRLHGVHTHHLDYWPASCISLQAHILKAVQWEGNGNTHQGPSSEEAVVDVQYKERRCQDAARCDPKCDYSATFAVATWQVAAWKAVENWVFTVTAIRILLCMSDRKWLLCASSSFRGLPSTGRQDRWHMGIKHHSPNHC